MDTGIQQTGANTSQSEENPCPSLGGNISLNHKHLSKCFHIGCSSGVTLDLEQKPADSLTASWHMVWHPYCRLDISYNGFKVSLSDTVNCTRQY